MGWTAGLGNWRNRLRPAAPVVVQSGIRCGTGWGRYPDQSIQEELELVDLFARTHDLPWANA